MRGRIREKEKEKGRKEGRKERETAAIQKKRYKWPDALTIDRLLRLI